MAAIGGHSDSVRVLLAHNGSLVNQACLGGKSPLRFALEAKHLEVAKILINHGANVNAVDLGIFLFNYKI